MGGQTLINSTYACLGGVMRCYYLRFTHHSIATRLQTARP